MSSTKTSLVLGEDISRLPDILDQGNCGLPHHLVYNACQIPVPNFDRSGGTSLCLSRTIRKTEASKAVFHEPERLLETFVLVLGRTRAYLALGSPSRAIRGILSTRFLIVNHLDITHSF
jgi:hypothetical protein